MTNTLKKSANKNNPEPDLTPIDHELELELLQKAEQAGQEEDAVSEPLFSLNSRREERQLALYLLYALDRAEYSLGLEAVVDTFERGFEIKIPKRSFAYTLTKQVLEGRDSLDEQLKPYLKNWRLERLGCCTHLILRLSLWELQQEGAISSIVINEAVELAKTFAEKDAYRFVNGILDEIAKAMFGEKDKDSEKIPSDDESKTKEDV
jgi:transcription antitermination protein NusB